MCWRTAVIHYACKHQSGWWPEDKIRACPKAEKKGRQCSLLEGQQVRVKYDCKKCQNKSQRAQWSGSKYGSDSTRPRELGSSSSSSGKSGRSSKSNRSSSSSQRGLRSRDHSTRPTQGLEAVHVENETQFVGRAMSSVYLEPHDASPNNQSESRWSSSSADEFTSARLSVCGGDGDPTSSPPARAAGADHQ